MYDLNFIFIFLCLLHIIFLQAGFQITQQKKPLAVNGEIKFNVFKPEIHKQPYTKSSKIKQIQLEQDSGRSFHNEDFGRYC